MAILNMPLFTLRHSLPCEYNTSIYEYNTVYLTTFEHCVVCTGRRIQF